eukprot:TCALIF_05013-PA protein Name:"Protein of unknown function" AED:0.08 eAED:0.08 QI:95/0.5/0.33/1/0/0.66/3/0/578
MSTVEGARSSPTSPKSKFDPEISMSESNSPYQTVITAVSPPRRGSGSMLVRYFEQVKKTVEEFIEDVGYAEMRPDHDLDPDESDVRLRVAAARIPRIQQRLNNLSEKEATLTKSLLDQGIEDPHHLMEKIETIVDSFERSQQSLHQKLANRPNLRQDLLPSLPIATTQDVGSYAVTPVKSVDDYDATKHVDPKFDGDKSDPECLQKFSSWKSAWDSAHATLRTLEGYSSKAAFKHLESVLTGEALKKIRLINRSGGTYELAINKLESFFGNKLGLAANYLTSVGEFEGSNLNMAAVIQDSVVGLESLQDTFVEDKVDPFQFSIIHHLQTLMESRPTMAESWLHFKKRRHEEFLAQQIGEKWHPSIVENSTSFKAWLDTFRANRPTAKSMNSKVKPSAQVIIDHFNVQQLSPSPTRNGFKSAKQKTNAKDASFHGLPVTFVKASVASVAVVTIRFFALRTVIVRKYLASLSDLVPHHLAPSPAKSLVAAVVIALPGNLVIETGIEAMIGFVIEAMIGFVIEAMIELGIEAMIELGIEAMIELGIELPVIVIELLGNVIISEDGGCREGLHGEVTPGEQE